MWDEGADAPTEYLPTFVAAPGDPMTRPRGSRRSRRSRPVLLTVLVAFGTIGAGSGSGLLIARVLDDSSRLAGGSVTASPARSPSAAVPLEATGRPTTAASVGSPTVRPTSTTRVSRSKPTRSASPSSTSSSPTRKPTSTGGSVGGVPSLEAAVLRLTNAERAKAGCQALRMSSKLTVAARRHSQHMADTGRHAHDGIGNGTPQTRIDATGYQWRGWAENIAWGYRSATSVMNGWMNSPGHRANILNCSYRDIGVGVDRGGSNWTQDFGIPG